MPKYFRKISKDAYTSTKCFLIVNWRKLMISFAVFIFAGIVAFFFLKEKSWFIDHFKEGYIYGICLLIAFPLVWLYYFLYGSPKKIWEENQRKIEQLEEKLNLIERRKKLAQDLVAIRDKYVLPNNHAGPLLDKSNPMYREVMDLLKNSDLFSAADLYFFERGKLPVIGAFHHPNNARGIMLETLIENALLRLRDEI